MHFGFFFFKCDGVESKNGIQVDKLSFTCVNLSKVEHKDDHFILVSQANQVFYVDDPMESEGAIARSAERRNISIDNDQDKVETLKQLNATNKEFVEINDSKGLIGLYTHKDINGVWIESN